MEAKTRLANWLASKEKKYSIGVSVFVELKVDPPKNKFFTINDPRNVHRNMLLKLLMNYARVNRINPILTKTTENIEVSDVKKNKLTGSTEVAADGSRNKKQAQRPKIDKNPVVDYQLLPKNLQLKFDQNGQLNSEIKTYHSELKLIADDSHNKKRRKDLAILIAGIRKQQRANWDEIDGWWNDQQNKNPEELAADAALEKDKRIKANLNYIRRNYNSTKPKAIKEFKIRMQELDAWEVEYGGLVEKLKAGGK